MSSSTKARIRRGHKAKSIAELPCSLTAFNLSNTPAVTEWVDEVDVAPRKKKKLRKSFTREFKLGAITMVYGIRINAKGTEVPAGIRCKL